MIDHEFLIHFQEGLISEWRGVVGWGFGCVFLLVSLGFFGRVLGWAPQNFLSSVESLVGEVGLWVGGTLGIAVIRSTHNTGVVIWPFWLPFIPVMFVLLLCGSWSGYVPLILWCVIILRIESAFFDWRIGWLRLGISLNKGDIRKDQVLVNRYNFLSLSLFFLFSSIQGLENIWLGQIPVCVVYFRSVWIRGVGYNWESGGIRALKARRVVIFLYTLYHRSASFFHSVLIFLFLGNLSLVFCFVASLSGLSTILATFACLIKGLGCYVQGRCTNHGEIRLELVTMSRTLFSTLNFVSIFLVPISDKQSLTYWFSFKPVSWFCIESFESDLLGSKGILGIWDWVAMIRRRYEKIMQMWLEGGKLLRWKCWHKRFWM
ncbi:hypothetical protein Hanom_Chr04g00303981 [Helianthus anomalus]